MKFSDGSPFPQTPNELLRSIAEWNAIDLSKASHDDLASIRKKIFSVLALRTHQYEGPFFRVVKGQLTTVQSELEAPRNQPPSRVATGSKRVLYTSLSVPAAVIEAGVDYGEEFNLITYHTKNGQSIMVNSLFSDEFIDEGFEGTDWQYLKIQKNFFDSEFRRHVTDGNSFQFLATQHLCWNLLDGRVIGGETQDESCEVDGFMYLSVAHFCKAWNVAVKADVDDSPISPFGVDKLQVECVQRCVRIRPTDSDAILVFPFMESTRVEHGRVIYDRVSRRPELQDGFLVDE